MSLDGPFDFSSSFFLSMWSRCAECGPQLVEIYILGSSTCFEWEGSSQVDGVKASSIIGDFSR